MHLSRFIRVTPEAALMIVLAQTAGCACHPGHPEPRAGTGIAPAAAQMLESQDRTDLQLRQLQQQMGDTTAVVEDVRTRVAVLNGVLAEQPRAGQDGLRVFNADAPSQENEVLGIVNSRLENVSLNVAFSKPDTPEAEKVFSETSSNLTGINDQLGNLTAKVASLSGSVAGAASAIDEASCNLPHHSKAGHTCAGWPFGEGCNLPQAWVFLGLVVLLTGIPIVCYWGGREPALGHLAQPTQDTMAHYLGLMQNAQAWAVHYSTVRMGVTTLLVGFIWGVYLVKDRPLSSHFFYMAALLSLVAALLMLFFTYWVYREKAIERKLRNLVLQHLGASPSGRQPLYDIPAAITMMVLAVMLIYIISFQQ